jgi:DNA-binding transcriptional LysR family regulator
MPKIHIRQVEAFRAVMTLRSMTKAAEFLGISQPAVSRLIADFQDTVGFKLFKRGRNSAEPTPDALLLFEQVDKLFLGLEELSQHIEAITSVHTGRLTIAATNSHASGFLPAMLAEFKRSHPNVVLSYHIQAHEQVIDWVASGRADIGFAIQPVAKSELTARTIASRDAHCIFPKGHPFEKKQSLHPRDFKNIHFVSFPRGTALRFMIDGLFDHAKVDRILHVEATSHHAVCSLVSEGLGVALVNPFAPIEGHPTPLRARPVSPSISIDVQLIYNGNSMSVTSEKFRDYVLAEGPGVLAGYNNHHLPILKKA